MPDYSKGAKKFLRERWLQRAIDRAETPNVINPMPDAVPVLLRLKLALELLEKEA